MSTNETDAGRNLAEEARRYAAQARLDGAEPDEIERNIDATRADLSATLAALERRLSVDRLVELTVGRIRDRGGEFAGNLTDAVTQHPIPLLLTSVGLGWLMLTSRRGGSAGSARPTNTARASAAGVRDAVASATDTVREQVRDAVDSSRETLDRAAQSVHETADSMRDTASRAAETTRAQVEHTRERLERLMEEQPLLLGVLGVAAGALIGALLPTTDAEGRLVGAAREKALAKAALTARNGYEAAREQAAAYVTPTQDEDAERPSRPH